MEQENNRNKSAKRHVDVIDIMTGRIDVAIAFFVACVLFDIYFLGEYLGRREVEFWLILRAVIVQIVLTAGALAINRSRKKRGLK